MAATHKLSFPSRLILSTAVFIILSGYVEARQCYWCGPLAEQVHRSRRAPPCEPNLAHPLTVCEPGYDHCAVVATSPPYVESRYCVKVYQDECYPVFCNSTKTWKMTCPCRGDLCNGLGTEREKEAFSVLPRLVAITHSRIKKRTITAQKIIKTGRKIINPDAGENVGVNTVEEASNDQPDNTVTATTKDNVDKEASTESTTEHSDVTVKQEDATPINSDAVLKDAITAVEAEQTSDIPTSTKMIELDILNPYPTNADRHEIYKDDIDVLADEPIKEPENDEKSIDEVTVEAETKTSRIPETSIEATTEATAKISSTVTDLPNTGEKGMNGNVKPSKELTAEAFQQDHSPAVKNEEPQSTMSTTIEKLTEFTTNTDMPASTTITPTIINVNLVSTTQSPKNNTKNHAVSVSTSMLTVFIQCLLVNNLI